MPRCIILTRKKATDATGLLNNFCMPGGLLSAMGHARPQRRQDCLRPPVTRVAKFTLAYQNIALSEEMTAAKIF